MRVIHTLLAHSIDYAGLFPPAGLDLSATVQNYALYRESESRWALGNLVLGPEHVTSFALQWPIFAREWPIAMILRTAGDCELLEDLLESATMRPRALECSFAVLRCAEPLARSLGSGTDLFVELSSGVELSRALAEIAGCGAKAKVRTGGLTRARIPLARDLARFLQCVAQSRVPFKATAGLHHLLRGEYPLSYEHDSERAVMHGFLNVLLAAALAQSGATPATLIELLEESSLDAFEFHDDQIHWREHSFMVGNIANSREHMMLSFGSCSFSEPIENLRQAGLLA